MKTKISAGLLMYRFVHGEIQVLLSHPGGPLFKNKSAGFWGIPKGEVEAGEELLEAAIREFTEETGLKPGNSRFIPLDFITNKSGKRVYAWMFEGNCDTTKPVKSNLFEMEWPPHSGQIAWFPEVDQIHFFGLDEAKQNIVRAQAPFIDRLADIFRPQASSCVAKELG